VPTVRLQTPRTYRVDVAHVQSATPNPRSPYIGLRSDEAPQGFVVRLYEDGTQCAGIATEGMTRPEYPFCAYFETEGAACMFALGIRAGLVAGQRGAVTITEALYPDPDTYGP
jgi:hypothetical protein